jgi:hypothetical protein
MPCRRSLGLAAQAKIFPALRVSCNKPPVAQSQHHIQTEQVFRPMGDHDKVRPVVS